MVTQFYRAMQFELIQQQKAQNEQGLLPNITISLNSLIGNYVAKLNFASKNIFKM
jgi:hypothetical protein